MPTQFDFVQALIGPGVARIRDAALQLGDATGALRKLMEWPSYRRLIGSQNCARAWRALGATIAPDAIVTRGVWMRGPERVTIGAGCHLHDVVLDAWDEIVIEENVLINSAKLLTAGHDIDSPVLKGVRAPIRIGRYVWVIHDVVILQGVTVGECAVLATRSVVTKDVQPYAVVAGNPARVIRERARVDFEYVPAEGIVG